MLKNLGLLLVGLLTFSCASPPVKTSMGDIDATVPGMAKVALEALNNMDMKQYLVYHKNYWPDQREQEWLKKRYYAVNVPIENLDFLFLSLFLTVEQKVTKKAIFSRPNEPLRRNLYNEAINSGAPYGVYVYYYDPQAEYYDSFDGKKKKDYFEAKSWQRLNKIPISYAVIPKKDSHKDLFKGIYHVITKDTKGQYGSPIAFESQEGMEITKIASPGVIEGYGFLQPKTGREYIIMNTENEIILIRVESNQGQQKTSERFNAHMAIKAGLSRQNAIFTAANKPLKKCDTATDRKYCEQTEQVEAQRQQDANRKKAEDTYWKEYWEKSNKGTPKFCQTYYGTPKDGLQTNTTFCK